MLSLTAGTIRERRILIRKRSLKEVAVRIGASCVFHSGALKILRMKVNVGDDARDEARKKELPFSVLLYHRVTPETDVLFPSQSVKAFEKQMRYLAQTYRVLSLAEIFDRIIQGKGIEPWTVAITFDDGYRDNYLYARRILKQYGLRATLFVATGYIGTGQVLWNDRLAWAIRRTEKRGITSPLNGQEKYLSLETLYEKKSALDLLLEVLKGYPEKEKKTVVDDLINELDAGNEAPEPMMLSWGELRQLANEEWDVGSHTVDHTILTKVSESVARAEITASKEILQKELQKPVHFFAYPNGKQSDFNVRIKRLVQEAGYRGALTTLPGFNSRSVDPFELRRHSPWEEHLPSFAIKLRWSYWRSYEELAL